jgi:hypothetical protein
LVIVIGVAALKRQALRERELVLGDRQSRAWDRHPDPGLASVDRCSVSKDAVRADSERSCG